MTNDPRRDPSWKPAQRKKVMGVPIPSLKPPTISEKAPVTHSLRPSPEAWEAAKRWSPAGIVAALLIAFFTIGEDRIVRIVRAVGAQEELIQKIDGLTVALDAERQERSKTQARLLAAEKNLSSLCDFVSDMNGGKPNPSWCSEDGRTIKVTTVQAPPPMRRTEAIWYYVPK